MTSIRLPESRKWDLLIRLAITRFASWWTNIDQILNHAAAYTSPAGDKAAVQLTTDDLPPLDVLLVLYIFMLDFDEYFTACREKKHYNPQLEKLCFPWPAIRDVIHMENMQYFLPRAARNLFSTLSGQSHDILTYLEGPPAYTESHRSPFEERLVASIKQQERFIEEAHELLWIRSPALGGSLAGVSIEYFDYQLKGISTAKESKSDLPFNIDLCGRLIGYILNNMSSSCKR
jgi:hypothetical protein